MPAKIVAGESARKRLGIDAGEKVDPPPKLSFSFQYWRQIRYFSFDPSPRAWLVDLLDRLAMVSAFTRAQWDGEVIGKKAWRYHRVDLSPPCPIERSDLNWLPKPILENPEEFPIYQFSLGTSEGRVAGFWETDDRFAIVLLDPHHNLQPSKDFGYKVTDCITHPGQTGLVHLAVDHVRSTRKCAETECDVHRELATIAVKKRIDGAHQFVEVVTISLEDTDKGRLEELMGLRPGLSMNSILKKGLESCEVEWIRETNAGS